MGMEGEYYPSSRRLDANLQLLEVRLEDLSEIPGLKGLEEFYQPKGILHGKGKLKVDFSKYLLGVKAEAHLRSSVDHLELAGVSLGSWDAIDLHYATEKGVTVSKKEEGIAATLLPSGDMRLFTTKKNYPVDMTLTWKKEGANAYRIESRNASVLLGYPFEKLMARVQLNPDRLMIQEIQGKGANVSFRAEQVEVVGDHPNLMKGQGMLTILNPIEKIKEMPFLRSEVLERLGLTPQTLIPVSGTIHYELKEGKIFLTKLKDVHTENKLLRYSLAKGTTSTIDLNGELDLSLTVQPYNLLIKGTELGTFQVGGTISVPFVCFACIV
jgi:hypothetical protein